MNTEINLHLELMRDKSKTFPHIQNGLKIKTARVWHCGYRSLSPLSEMTNIEELVIGTLPDPTLEFLQSLTNLRYLRIVHMPKITSLHAFEKLIHIETLSLSTSPSWDAAKKCTVIDSLTPLAKLPMLRQLELFGVCPSDKSLQDLMHCTQLQSARLSQYPQDEVDRFYRETGLSDSFVPEPSFNR